MSLFAVIVLAVFVLAVAGAVIVWRGDAVDKDKAKAALQSAEARTENTLADWFTRIRAKFK